MWMSEARSPITNPFHDPAHVIWRHLKTLKTGRFGWRSWLRTRSYANKSKHFKTRAAPKRRVLFRSFSTETTRTSKRVPKAFVWRPSMTKPMKSKNKGMSWRFSNDWDRLTSWAHIVSILQQLSTTDVSHVSILASKKVIDSKNLSRMESLLLYYFLPFTQDYMFLAGW